MSDLTAVFAGKFAAATNVMRDQAAGVLPSGLERAATAKPVLQLNAFPSPIDLEKYKDAHSGDNPNGDYWAAYRLRNLCYQIPAFTRCFNASGNYVEHVWAGIVYGAEGTSSYAGRLLAEAQRRFENSKLANYGGIADSWLPVDASPSNWADLVKTAPEVVLDFTKPSLASGYLLINGADPLLWHASGSGDQKQKAALEGKIESITLRALKVDFLRNWLDFQIFGSGGWNVPGQDTGFYSSGDQVKNAGVFPLLPTAMIVGVDVTVRGDWGAEDKVRIENILKRGEPLGLGPFPLAGGRQAFDIDNTGIIRSQIAHVVGYISALVPFAPRETSLKPGAVLVRNDGGFVARFSVQWRTDGMAKTVKSDNFPVLSAKSIDIPAGARAIEIQIEIMTLPKPFETWKTVATYQFAEPVQKSFRLSETTFDPKIDEMKLEK